MSSSTDSNKVVIAGEEKDFSWLYPGMSRGRYQQLVLGKTAFTDEERLEWHFCSDWDGLLIHKDDPEFSCCTCSHGKEIKDRILHEKAHKDQ